MNTRTHAPQSAGKPSQEHGGYYNRKGGMGCSKKAHMSVWSRCPQFVFVHIEYKIFGKYLFNVFGRSVSVISGFLVTVAQ